MGFRYRKSVNIGPFRVNLSKTGVGYSIGGPGFRTGMRSNGRRYTSVGLPGTGMSYMKEHGKSGRRGGMGCLMILLFLVPSWLYIGKYIVEHW